MTKIKIQCNHCKQSINYYEYLVDEVGFIKVENKFYCEECCRKILKEHLEL